MQVDKLSPGHPRTTSVSITKTVFFIAVLVLSHNSFAESKTYTFGIVPQQSASTMAKVWIPLLSHLEKASGVSLRFKTDSSIPKFEEKLAKGEYDLAYMNPYHYVVFHEQSQYEAIAKAKDKLIKGIIVVPRNSPIVNLDDLHGKTMAFPAPAAFAASILPRAYLKSKHIDITATYVNSHDSVYANVALGRYTAGGGVMRTFKNTPEKYRNELKVLWTTNGYTPHAFAGLSTINTKDLEKVKQAMIDLDKSEDGKKLLNALKLQGIEAARNKDWDDVRELNINLLK